VESRKSKDKGSFEGLNVWQKACDVSVGIYHLLRHCKDYGLKDQMQRSAVSIASNIAEGSERGSRAEFRQFLRYAKGSAAELRTQLFIASKIAIISLEDYQQLSDQLLEISKMLEGLRASLKDC
jgi:four helix bundle protein